MLYDHYVSRVRLQNFKSNTRNAISEPNQVKNVSSLTFFAF